MMNGHNKGELAVELPIATPDLPQNSMPSMNGQRNDEIAVERPGGTPDRPKNPMALNFESPTPTESTESSTDSFLERQPALSPNEFTIEDLDDQGNKCTPRTFYGADYEQSAEGTPNSNGSSPTQQEVLQSPDNQTLQDVPTAPAAMRSRTFGSVRSASPTRPTFSLLQCPPPPSTTRQAVDTNGDDGLELELSNCFLTRTPCSTPTASETHSIQARSSETVSPSFFIPINPPKETTRVKTILAPKARRCVTFSSGFKELSSKLRIPLGCYQQTLSFALPESPPRQALASNTSVFATRRPNSRQPNGTTPHQLPSLHPACNTGMVATPHHNNNSQPNGSTTTTTPYPASDTGTIATPHHSNNSQPNGTSTTTTPAPFRSPYSYQPRPAVPLEEVPSVEWLDLSRSRPDTNDSPNPDSIDQQVPTEEKKGCEDVNLE